MSKNGVGEKLGRARINQSSRLFSELSIVLDALRDKWRKAVLPVKGGHHRLHPLVEGYVQAPVELRCQVRVINNATSDVGQEDGPARSG